MRTAFQLGRYLYWGPDKSLLWAVLYVAGWLALAVASTHKRLAAPLHSVTVSSDIVKGPRRHAWDGCMERGGRAWSRSLSVEKHWFRK